MSWSDAQIRARNQSAPIKDVMRFHLTYRGPLSASASSPKGAEISAIRSEISPQLEALWQTHPALEVLDQQGWVSPIGNNAGSISVAGRKLSPKKNGQAYER